MKNIFNKTNAPYLAVGALATLALVSSGVFAVAPYIGFLAPVAALSVGLPFIIGGAIFSAVVIALSAVAISKNNTISEKEAQLADEKSKVETKDTIISEKDAIVQAQEQTISEKEDQLAEKSTDISNLRDQLDEEKARVQTQKQTISEKEDQLANQEKEIEDKDKIISERDTKIEKDALKVEIADDAVQLANVAISLTKEAANGTWDLSKYVYNNYVPSIESTKGTLSGIGGGLKNTYDASIASVREALNSVGSSLYSRFHGTKVSSKEKFESRVVQRKQGEAKALGLLPKEIILQYKISSPEEQFEREDGSNFDYLDLAVPSSEQKQRANSLDYLNIDTAKSDSMSLSEDQDVFYDAESGDEKGTEISSPESQPTKEENGQGWFAWSLGKAKSVMTEVVVVGADVTKPYFAKVTKALALNFNM